MSQLIIQLIVALLSFYCAINSCRKLEDKIKESLSKLDNLCNGDPGYFSMSQRYYDSRKLLVLSHLLAASLSLIVIYLSVDIYSLLNL